MIELSRTQDEEVGDGTTSVIILGDRILAYLDPSCCCVLVIMQQVNKSCCVPCSIACVLLLNIELVRSIVRALVWAV